MITVLVPNYNHAIFLDQRINSILSQTLIPNEILILDDSSTDNSLQILTDFKKLFPQLNIISNIINSGSTFAQWNKGVDLAQGEYVWIAESDDAAAPKLLEVLSQKMNSDPEIVLAYCQSYRMNSKSEVNGSWHEFTEDLDPDGLFYTDFVMNGKEYIRNFLLHRNTIPNASAVLFRKSVFDKIGGAPIQLKTNGDWLTWLKMLCYGKVAYISEPLNYFRKHDKSVIAKTHQFADSDVYKEKYDFTMRYEFLTFLKNTDMVFPNKVLQKNAHYMSMDLGNKGLFSINKGEYLNGWKDVLRASFYPKLQSGFIKKGLGLI